MMHKAGSLTGNDWVQSVPSFQNLSEEIREAHLSSDLVGMFVKKWSIMHCLDDEQRIPLLNFDNLVLNNGERQFVIRNGISADGYAIGYSASFDNAGAGFNL